MAHRSLLDATRVVSGAPEKGKSKKGEATSTKAVERARTQWGTPEEKYRRLCMLCMLCRYSYYCHSTSIVDDVTYDRLERVILFIEDKHRELMHPGSPTARPGSDRPESYPRSARDFYDRHVGDPRAFEPIGKAVEWFLVDAAKTFGIDPGRIYGGSEITKKAGENS